MQSPFCVHLGKFLDRPMNFLGVGAGRGSSRGSYYITHALRYMRARARPAPPLRMAECGRIRLFISFVSPYVLNKSIPRSVPARAGERAAAESASAGRQAAAGTRGSSSEGAYRIARRAATARRRGAIQRTVRLPASGVGAPSGCTVRVGRMVLYDQCLLQGVNDFS